MSKWCDIKDISFTVNAFAAAYIFFAFMQIERDERKNKNSLQCLVHDISTQMSIEEKSEKHTIGQRSDRRSSKCQFALPFPITLFFAIFVYISKKKHIELKMN